LITSSPPPIDSFDRHCSSWRLVFVQLHFLQRYMHSFPRLVSEVLAITPIFNKLEGVGRDTLSAASFRSSRHVCDASKWRLAILLPTLASD
jgi:hypothetical protein